MDHRPDLMQTSFPNDKHWLARHTTKAYSFAEGRNVNQMSKDLSGLAWPLAEVSFPARLYYTRNVMVSYFSTALLLVGEQLLIQQQQQSILCVVHYHSLQQIVIIKLTMELGIWRLSQWLRFWEHFSLKASYVLYMPTTCGNRCPCLNTLSDSSRKSLCKHISACGCSDTTFDSI